MGLAHAIDAGGVPPHRPHASTRRRRVMAKKRSTAKKAGRDTRKKVVRKPSPTSRKKVSKKSPAKAARRKKTAAGKKAPASKKTAARAKKTARKASPKSAARKKAKKSGTPSAAARGIPRAHAKKPANRQSAKKPVSRSRSAPKAGSATSKKTARKTTATVASKTASKSRTKPAATKKTARKPKPPSRRTPPKPEMPSPDLLFEARTEYWSTAPVTDAIIALTEQALGVRLPPAYVALMRKRNGGDLRLRGYMMKRTPPPTTGLSRRVYTIDQLPPIGDTHDQAITRLASDAREAALDDALIPMNADAPAWLCLDYRASGPKGAPAVTHVDTDARIDFIVADSFDDLLLGLHFDAGGRFVFAIDDAALDPAFDPGPLDILLAALGCERLHTPGGPIWHCPRFRAALEDSAVITPMSNQPEQWCPARPANHPMLLVDVVEDDQAECIGALAAALDRVADLVHAPRDRKPIPSIAPTA
jgi:hypothetical protein